MSSWTVTGGAFPGKAVRISLMIAHVSVQGVLISENGLAVTMNGVKFIVAFKGEAQSYSTVGKPFKTSINRSTLGAKLIGTIDLTSTPQL